MCDITDITIHAESNGPCLNIEVRSLTGNTQQAVSDKQVIGVLANTIVLFVRNQSNTNQRQIELIEFCTEQINDAFTCTDFNVYKPNPQNS